MAKTQAPPKKASISVEGATVQNVSIAKSRPIKYPRKLRNGSVELAPPPEYGPKLPKGHRAARLRALVPPPVAPPERTPSEVRAAEKALEKHKASLIKKRQEMLEHQKEVAEHNKKLLKAQAKPPVPAKPMKLRVKIKAEPIKVIVLRGHSYSYRRPCGDVPEEFQGVHVVPSDSPMFSRKGSWPPAHYNDSVPLPNLAMGVWLSEKAQNDLARMQREAEALSGRCLQEINETAKSGKYKSALFPEIKRRMVMSLIQALKETL